MSEWSTDISKAPRGKMVTTVQRREKGDVEVQRFAPDPVILASKCGKVIKSHWIPPEYTTAKIGRWHCFHDSEEPEAWAVWPKHPRASADGEIVAW